jgi:hypothetical protein
MAKQKQKNASMLAVLMISMLSLGSFAYTYSAVTGNTLLSAAQAKDGEDDDGEDDKDEDKDEDEDENDDKEDKSKKEAEKRAKEAAKQKAEWQREQLKKKTEALRKTEERKFEVRHKETESEDANDDNGNDGVEDENEDESDDDSAEKLTERRSDALEDMSEDIIEAEERIARAQAEGIDVTKALATLAAAKAKVAAFESSSEPVSRDTLKQLEREVKKLTHFASHKDVKSSRDMTKDVDKIAKRISQAKGKLALYESLGGSSDSFKSALTNLESDFAALQTKLASGGQEQIDALSQLESFERKVKVFKSSIESAIYALGGTDERYDDDYENEVEDLYEDLNDVAEIEGDELGEQIRSVAEAQKSSVSKVATSVENIDKRSRLLQALFGAKKTDIENLQNEIAANKARIEVLNQAAAKIEDPEVKSILTEQISSLTQETSKLETFVSGQKDRLSAFGWVFNLFGN